MKKQIKETAYEKYQLDWMIQHGHSIRELLGIFREAMEKNGSTADSGDYVENYFKAHGFDGERFSCYGEFLEAEYTDTQYMLQLLSKNEFMEYLKDNFSNYDYFEVSEDRVVKIVEYGYMAEDSVTDNPKETFRKVDCSGAEFSLDSLSGDDESDSEMVGIILEDAKQYISDVTDKQFYEHIYELLSDGAIESNYLNKKLQAGKYILIR